MWPCQKRWLVFCRQGVSAAYIRLRELIAKHTTLTVQTSVAAPAPDTDSGVAMLAAEPSQAEQELAACKQDIVSLIQAMYKQLKQKLHQETVPGYESFGDIALAFELPSLYEALLKDSLEVSNLTVATSCEPRTVPCPALPCPALPRPAFPGLALPRASLPGLALPCLALPCLALPCLALPCPALPCPAQACLARPCPALPGLALPCASLPGLALPCLALPCLALPCPALPCPALPCPALLCPA